MNNIYLLIATLILVSCAINNVKNTNYSEVIIYENDFSNNSLSDFIIGEIGDATVSISQEKLQINPGEGYLNRGFVALDLNAISTEYKSRLDDNLAKITWAFNVSNVDGTVCGACNNLFGFYIYSFPDIHGNTAFGYRFTGGGYVGNRMLFSQNASASSLYGPVFNILIDITNGLGPMPTIGAFKITYDHHSSIWELYYEESLIEIDPMTITNMIGSIMDNSFSNEQLPYIMLSSENTSSTYFDNLTIMLEY